MKENCDNHCETCPVQSQIYCSLVFSKATNKSMEGLVERLEAIEKQMKPTEASLINPLAKDKSEILPAQEVGDNILNT